MKVQINHDFMLPAVTLRQPRASLLVADSPKRKVYIARQLKHPINGVLAIHAAQTREDVHEIFPGTPMWDAIQEAGIEGVWPYGAVVGVVAVEAMEEITPDFIRSLCDRERLLLRPGEYAWRTRLVLSLLDRPAPAKGRSGVWYWRPPRDLYEEVMRHAGGGG